MNGGARPAREVPSASPVVERARVDSSDRRRASSLPRTVARGLFCKPKKSHTHTSRTMSAAAAHSTATLALRAKLQSRKVSRRSSKASTVVRASAVAAPAGAAKETIDDAINSVRFLAIDAINKSNSGHPGLPMGCAPMGYVIFREAMTHNPQNAKWFNRDRFVLSAGHGCMLQYSLMHLTGYPSVSVRVRHVLSSIARFMHASER